MSYRGAWKFSPGRRGKEGSKPYRFTVKHFLSVNGRDKGPEIGTGLAEPENNRDGPADTVADERGGVALGSERKQKDASEPPVTPLGERKPREAWSRRISAAHLFLIVRSVWLLRSE